MGKAEALFALRVKVAQPSVGVSADNVLVFGQRPIEAGRLLAVKQGGLHFLAQVYHSRRRKALRLRRVGLPKVALDLDAVTVVGTAMGLEVPSITAWTEEAARRVREWRPEYVRFGRGGGK